VTRAPYADATAPKGEDWTTVDVEPVKALVVPVTLAAIKQSKKLQKMALVKKSRISVVPVTAAEVREVLKMGKTVV
jgi:predicted RNA-binding protein with PUA-like domain